MSSYTLDFKKLESQGISKAKTIDYLRNNTQSNFNFDELESLYQSKGYTPEATTEAIYKDLSNFKSLRITPKHQSKAASESRGDKAHRTQDFGTNTMASIDSKGEVSSRDFGGFGARGEGSYLSGSEQALSEQSAKSTEETSPSLGRTSSDVIDDMRALGFTSALDSLKSGATLGFYTPESEKKRREALRELGKEAKQKGIDLQDLPSNYKQLLAEEYDEQNSFFKASELDFSALNPFQSDDEKAKAQLAKAAQREAIAKAKDPSELTDEQRKLIADDEGFLNNAWDYFFKDEKEVLKNYQEKLKSQEVTKDAQKALEFLNNIHSSKSVASALLGASKEEQEDYLKEVLKIGDVLGFDDVGQDSKGHIYFFKGEQAYKINEGFFDNFGTILEANVGSIGLGLAGAAQGAKLGKDLRSKAVGAIIGGAVGSFAGGSADYLIANAYLNRENNFNEMLSHATQEGLLSVAGDLAALGLAKGGKALVSKYKDGSLAQSVGKLIDYTPVVGFGKRALDGNAKAAQALIDTTYTKEQQEALRSFGESFGGGISFSKDGASAMGKAFEQSFGADSKAFKAFESVSNALTLPNQREQQRAFIQAIRADESGNLIAFLSEAAAQSPKANENLRSILNATTHKLTQNLEALNLNKGDIKAIFDELESGTKGSYDEAINGVLSQIYDDTYKVVLDRSRAVEGAKAQSKSTLQADLNTQEIQEAIAKWDLSNPKSSDKLIISKVDDTELELLNKEFDFKGNYAIAREIDAQHIAHALNRHQADLNAANIPLSKDEIFTHYPNITRDYDHRVVTTNNTIIYAKQVNGHFIAIEEVLTGKNKLRFDTAWKQKGELNKEVLFKNARVFPNTIKSHKVASDERNLDQILGGTSHNQNPSKSHSTTKRQSYNAFRKELEEQGLLDENGLKFLNFVEKNVYSDKGVSFTQLNNALKMINSYYKEATDPNLKSHIKNAVENFLREDIKEGIEQILAQNKSAYKDAKSLYETALKDYANMKGTLKLVDKIKLRDIKTTQNKAIESLLNLAKGQGDKLDNLSLLSQALKGENRAVLELNMLQSMFHRALYDKDALKVFDSGAFFKELEALSEGTFQSRAAKDFIELAQGFHTLFKNDILIAQSLKPTTTQGIGSSIATTIEGAIRFQLVREAFSHIIRLLPHIPFMGALNEKVSGAALRYHLKSALRKSYSVSDFKAQISQKVAKASFDNDTKALLRAMSEGVEKAQDSMIEGVEKANLKAANASDMREYATLQKYDVSSLHLLTKQEYESFVDSVLSGEVESLKAAPNIVHIANLSDEISQELGLNNAKVFLRKNDLHHFRSERKGAYNQDVPREVIKALPEMIESATDAYIDKVHKNFFITRELSEKEVAMFVGNKDELGNYLIHAKRVLKDDLNKSEYSKVGSGIEPHIERHASDDASLPSGSSPTIENIPLAKEDKAPASAYPHQNKLTDSTSSPIVESASSVDSTTESLIEKALREKSELLAQKEAALKEKEAQAAALAKEAQEARKAIIKEKAALNGLKENERILHIGESIPAKKIEHLKSSVSLDDESIYPLDFVIVKASDIKPNFEGSATQTRTQARSHIIESIAQDFKPEMILSRGGFDDVPIILSDGQVLSGNHRAQGMKDFSQKSRHAYQEAIKSHYGVELGENELLVRMPQGQLDTKELINLAAASNKERLSNIGDKVISSLGRFDKHIESLGRIESQSVDELAQSVASKLDKNGAGEIEAPNLALLAHLAPNSGNNSLSHVLNSLSKELDMSDFNALKDMYVKTAGQWHNLTQNTELASLTLSPYLLQAIEASGRGLKRSRAENFTSSLEKIDYMLKNTDSSGSNALLEQNKSAYDDIIRELLGYSLARFARLENPAANLYEFLKGARDGLENQVAPSLFGAGKPLKEADIYDFIELAIKSGESSPSTSAVIDALPALREKHKAFAGGKAKEISESSKEVDNALKKDLSSQEIEQAISQWDLSKAANANAKQKMIVSQVGDEEAELLAKDYSFKGKRPLVREIDSHQILHTLKEHGDESIEAARGQKAIDLKDISQYQDIVKEHDLRIAQSNGRIVYAKQINGHHIVVEEVLEGQDKLRYFDMWKQNGELNKEVLLSHSQRPSTSPSQNLESHMINSKEHSQANSQINAPTPYDDIAQSNAKLDGVDSTPKLYKMQETKIESEQDLGKYASMLGLKFENDAQAKAAYEFINAHRERIEC